MGWRARIVSLTLFSSACAGGDTAPEAGFETGECVAGQCLAGLVCASGVCVPPGSGATEGPPGTTSSITTAVPTGGMDDDGFDDSSTAPSDSTGPDGACPFTNDGKCDEPDLCPVGTDVDDCRDLTCPFTNDGECDEPEGTGKCPEGTDVDDCMREVCGGPVPAAPAMCNQWMQNCPAGEKCNPYATAGDTWDAVGCFPLACEAAEIGETCMVEGGGTSGVDNCVAGAMCWNVNPQGAGYCIAMCSGSPNNASCSDATCIITNGGVLSLCLPACDPLMQDCQMGEGCYPVNEDFACAPDASGVGGANGATCASINACDPGLACVGPAALASCNAPVGCCTPFCDVASAQSDATCAALNAAHTCVAWFPDGAAPPGYENVGVCGLG